MRFWDSSAIIPLLVKESQTGVVSDIYGDRSGMLVWWATEVECVSAIARRERDGSLPSAGAGRALRRLDLLKEEWHELRPTERTRSTARRLLRVHPLREGGALQLASAVMGSEEDPRSLDIVTLDDRLSEAAQKEGFTTIPES